MIFIIFLHTFKVSLLLISMTACKKAIDGPEIGLNWVKNLQKRMFLKFCGSRIDEWNIALCSTYFDDLYRISTYILQTSDSQIGVGSVEVRIFFVFMSFKNFKRKFPKSKFFKIRTLYTHFSGSFEQYALYSSWTCWYGCLLPNFGDNSKFIFPT